MSESEKYSYVINNVLQGYDRDVVVNHVDELERQITELKESQKQKQIIKLCERLDKAEQQNKELIEALSIALNDSEREKEIYQLMDLLGKYKGGE